MEKPNLDINEINTLKEKINELISKLSDIDCQEIIETLKK